jgi:sigma-B regulation protein RsbU (phosphoserine phosphatase)
LTQMCGDYYDYIKLGPKRLMVSIGDVSGHGVGPALHMAEVRCTTRIFARLGGDLPSIMCDLNRTLCDDLPESSFVSLFLVDIDIENRRLCYLGAGHDAFLIRADGAECRLQSTHPLLGIDPSVGFLEVASTGIGKGDVLFVFTDGLNEARSVAGEDYGRKRAVEIVCRHRQEPSDRILQELFRSVFEFTSGKNLTDDITAVVVKVID